MPHHEVSRPHGRAVVVNWNGRDLVPACLASLTAQTCRADFEIVVVDNASTDGSAAWLNRCPDIDVRHAPRNLGFAGGMHLATTDFVGDWLVLLNSDATFAPDAVERMVAVLDAPGHERVGAVTAKILLAAPAPDGTVLVNSTGNVITRRGTGADRDWLVPEGQESSDPEVFGFCGGAALLRGTALREVGGFDPTLFLYYEDTDLSWRLRLGGWSVRYEPTAVARHQHAASSDVRSALFRYYNTRNSLLVFTRYAPARIVAAAVARQLAGAARAAVPRARRRTAQHPAARWRAIAGYLARLPHALGDRRRAARAARVPASEVARSFL